MRWAKVKKEREWREGINHGTMTKKVTFHMLKYTKTNYNLPISLR